MFSRNTLLAAAASVASGIALYFGSGLHPVWWLMWVAPIPVLLAAPYLSRRSSFVASFVAWCLGGLNLWSYLRGLLDVPLAIVIAVLAVPALIFALAVLLTRSLLLKRKPWLAAFAIPALWVSYEYLSALASPHSTFGNLGYTQMNFLPLIQIASLTGIWGISFVALLFAGTLATQLGPSVNPKQRLNLAASVGLLLGTIFFYGSWRLGAPSRSQHSVAVLLMVKDVPDSAYPDDDSQALALFREYAEELRRATPLGTQVIVLPEKIARISEEVIPQVDALFSSTAADVHAGIVVGLVRKSATGAFNESRFYSAEGKLRASYDKHHLIPGIEKELPGTARVLLQQPSGLWGLTICKDMDFPPLSREYGADGAVLLLVPAWDFNADGWLHGRMAVLRSVEEGFGIARSARNGVLTISDNRGRILAEAASSSAPFAVVKAALPTDRESTPYQRFGDWFAWLNLALLCVILVSLFRS